jgi:hypothetical protein
MADAPKPFTETIAKPAHRHRSHSAVSAMAIPQLESVRKPTRPSASRQRLALRTFRQSTMTGKPRRCCAGLLTFRRNLTGICETGFVNRSCETGIVKFGETHALWRHVGSEQFRPAIILALSHHVGRDEHFFSLFQIL